MQNRFKKRRCRRHAVLAIICTLEKILNMEVVYYLSIPNTHANEDLQNKSGYTVDTLDYVIDSLRHIYQ